MRCRVCGRPVPPRKGATGRTKEIHSTCSIVASRVAELERLLCSVQWGSARDVRLMRGELFAIVNGPLRADRAVIAPENDADI